MSGEWAYAKISGGGDRWRMGGPAGTVTLVRLPGTLVRAYLPDGTMRDYSSPDAAMRAESARCSCDGRDQVSAPHHYPCGVELDRFEDVDAITAAADAAGYEAGTAAGGWVLDGNSSEETARALLRGIEDGDPMILDQLPSAPLSGEWADGLLPRDLLRDYGMTEDHPAADDVLTAYEDGYARGVVDEVTRAAYAVIT